MHKKLFISLAIVAFGIFGVHFANAQTASTDGCQPGFNFNVNTGAKCSTTTAVDGCTGAFAYSPYTGQACSNYVPLSNPTTPLGGTTSTSSGIVPLTFGRTLGLGSTGDDVKELQGIVGATEDGDFGPETAAKLQAWQAAHGLNADSVFGPQSQAEAEHEHEGGAPGSEGESGSGPANSNASSEGQSNSSNARGEGSSGSEGSAGGSQSGTTSTSSGLQTHSGDN